MSWRASCIRIDILKTAYNSQPFHGVEVIPGWMWQAAIVSPGKLLLYSGIDSVFSCTWRMVSVRAMQKVGQVVSQPKGTLFIL